MDVGEIVKMFITVCGCWRDSENVYHCMWQCCHSEGVSLDIDVGVIVMMCFMVRGCWCHSGGISLYTDVGVIVKCLFLYLCV